MLECRWNFVGCGAAIKRLYRGKRKRQAALCPIHTMLIRNSRGCGPIRLTRGRRRSVPARTFWLEGLPIEEVRSIPITTCAFEASQGTSC